LKAIGAFALTGNIVGAAASLFSMLTAPPDPVLEALKIVNKKLDLILKDLAIISEQQSEVLLELREINRLLQTSFAEGMSRLTRIEAKIDEARAQALTVDRKNHTAEFLGVLDVCRSTLVNNDWQSRPGAFRDRLTTLYGYSIHTSKLPAMTGDAGRALDVSSAATELRSRGYVDVAFGLLPSIVSAATMPIKYSVTHPSLPEPAVRANPVCWAQGANAYLEARAASPALPTKDDTTYLPILWVEGVMLVDVVRAATNPMIKAKLVDAIQPLAGVRLDGTRLKGPNLIALLEDIVGAFQTTMLTPHYKLTTLDWMNVNDGRVLYGIGPETFKPIPPQTRPRRPHLGLHCSYAAQCVAEGHPRQVYSVESDPLELAIKAGILERVNVAFADDMQPYLNNGGQLFPLTASQLLIKKGARAGQFVGGADARLFETDTSSDHKFSQRHRAWEPLLPRSGGQDPVPLFDECFALLRSVVDYPVVRGSDLAQRIRSTFQGAALAPFNDYTTIGRLFGALAIWARGATLGQLNIAPDEACFDNVLVPASTDKVVEAVIAYIKEKLQPSTDYVAPIAAEFSRIVVMHLSSLFEHFNVSMDGLTLPFVDTTLRRLAGYMDTFKIEYPRPIRGS
jgi:hypothetical protein